MGYLEEDGEDGLSNQLTNTNFKEVKKMKKAYSISLLSFTMTIIIGLLSFARGNMLTNPGFEIGNTDGWGHWSMKSAVTDGEKYSGLYSVELGLPDESDNGALLQEVTEGFSIDKPLHAFAWIKTEGLDADAFLKLEFWGENGLISAVESNRLTGANTWTKISISTSYVPGDTTLVKLLLQLSSDSGDTNKGKAYFDDVYLDVSSKSAQ